MKGRAGREQIKDIHNPDAQAPNAGAPSAFAHFHRDALQAFGAHESHCRMRSMTMTSALPDLPIDNDFVVLRVQVIGQIEG